jgi:prolyl-tRNA synthetase
MKDAYSFDWNDEGLDASYQAQRDAYERIFQRLGLDYVIVRADAGAMGGSKSEEFLHPIEVGEDTFVQSPGGYAANVEAYEAPVGSEQNSDGVQAAVIHDSPDTPTIATLVDLANRDYPRDDRPWEAADTLKNVVLTRVAPDGARELVIVGLPGDRDVDMKRAEAAFSPMAVEAATEEDFAAHPGLVKGYIGPWSPDGPVLGTESATGIPFFVDPRVAPGTQWVTGANIDQKHVFHLVYGRDFAADGVLDIGNVRDGDPAPDGSGPVVTKRGMEIGHVFQLGRKYAEALGLQVLDDNGKLVTVTMGSYGIGVTRIMAVLAESHHDDKGLIWPENVAPYAVHVIAAGKDDVVWTVANTLVDRFDEAGIDVLFDDRPKVSPGVKFADAEIIGVPHIVIVGRGAADGVVELWDRKTGERTEVAVEDAPHALFPHL